jgi:hypothetical protein
MVGERKRGTACPGRRQFRCGGDDRPESALSAEPHRVQDRAADRACAFESCAGFRAALLCLCRDVANHSTGHSRRGGDLGVGVLGPASPFFAGEYTERGSRASTSETAQVRISFYWLLWGRREPSALVAWAIIG